jgi:hypothetical protein
VGFVFNGELQVEPAPLLGFAVALSSVPPRFHLPIYLPFDWRPANFPVKASSFAFQFRGAAAVKLAAPSKLSRKRKFPDPPWPQQFHSHH